MSQAKDDDFFIGWARPAPGLARFLIIVTLASLLAFAGAAYLTAATQSDPGDGTFRWGWGELTLTGTVSDGPYPILHVAEGPHGLAGRSLLMSRPGKNGVREGWRALIGQRVIARGIALTRGDIVMLQIRGDENGLRAADDQEPPPSLPAVEDLGTWRLTGEICDGKCYNGAMRPGTGLAHKACANLCIAGGVPAVFVATGEVEGAQYFVLGDADGNPVTETVKDWTAVLVNVTGRIEKIGPMPVIYADLASLEVAR